MKKPRGDAKLKILGDALQEELFQFLRRHTMEATLEWLKADHGLSSSDRSLSDFYHWYPRKMRLLQVADFASQLESTLKQLPALKVTAEQASQVAAVSFEIQAARDQDPELFAMLSKGKHSQAQLQLEREKFEHAKKADWEHGLEALHAEIKGNAEALKHFEAMKAALTKGRS